jgi:glycosyltransferase involved in cell wall biosynthesis
VLIHEAFFIAVCTLGESLNLTRCINALLEISENSSENIQIAVIVNNERSKLVFDHKIKVFFEPMKGYSSVRNAAISNVPRNSNLIFIDDDEIPTISWFEYMVASHRKFPADVIFGPVFPDSDSNSGYYRENFRGKYESMPDGALVKQAGAGNMLIPSYLFEENRVAFDPYFNLSGSEDTDLCFKLRKQGVKIRYAKKAIIKEIQSPERCDLKYLKARRLRDTCNYSVVIRRNSSLFGIVWRFATLTLRLAFYSVVSIFSPGLRFEQRVYLKSTQALLTGKVI